MSSKYIIRLAKTATEDDLRSTIRYFEDHGGKITHHHTLFKGFSGELPDNKLNIMESLPHVEAIEMDQMVKIQPV